MPPRFVSVICSGDIPTIKKEEREKEIRLAARVREKEMAGTDGAGGAWG